MSSKSSLHILKGELLQFFRKINKSSDSELIIAIFSELISSEEILYRYYTNSYGRIVKVINKKIKLFVYKSKIHNDYQLPLFSIDIHGSLGGSGSPF